MKTSNQMALRNRSVQGFTLIELLVVISILGTLAGMFTLAYRGAQQDSNTQKTRLTIQKISDVLRARMQDYETYPVPTGIPATASVATGFHPGMKMVLEERARLLMLRSIIRTEMPDHPDDLKATQFWGTANPPIIYAMPTGLTKKVGALNVPIFVPGTDVMPNALTSRAANMYAKLKLYPQWDATNANAELLYLIVEDSELDGSSAIEAFGASEIADTDGDGLYEFIDAFGYPIQWIRWPSGFSKVGSIYPDMLDSAILDSSGNLKINSEPYDRLKADPGWSASNSNLMPSVYPMPLVVSAGPDGFFGLNFREYNRYNSPSRTPRWPVGGSTSYSTSDLVYPDNIYGVPFRFSDPWGPRLNPEMRMGGLLDPANDPIEGGRTVSNPPFEASDNITNYEGAAVSL